MGKVTQNSQTYRVRCNCGETCEVTLNEEIDVTEIAADACIQAEEDHGWGEHGYCPRCQGEIDEDIAICHAADAERMERRVA